MRLSLPDVTLCAVTSLNVEATLAALQHSRSLVDFGACLLVTDVPVRRSDTGIRIVSIERLRSSEAYSRFVIAELPDHIETGHCLMTQWDGFVINPGKWSPAFLDYDYIGAPWPQFDDGHDVGNGGFSLRSRRLLDACRLPGFTGCHPEDVTIARTNRAFLEAQGIRIADRSIAERFSCERDGDPADTFGFHGVFRMIEAIGADRFWEVYCGLDDRTTLWRDMATLWQQLGGGRDAPSRRMRLLLDRARDAIHAPSRRRSPGFDFVE